MVISLRNFIREVLDLDALPHDVRVPNQGPTRSIGSKAKEDRGRDEGKQGGKNLGADADPQAALAQAQGFASDDSSEEHHES